MRTMCASTFKGVPTDWAGDRIRGMSAFGKRSSLSSSRLWLGALMAVSLSTGTHCLAQTAQYAKICDLPLSGLTYPGDILTVGLTESPTLPGVFFGQLGLNENAGDVFWVNDKGVFGIGQGVPGNCPQGTLISAGDGTFWGTSGGMGGSNVIWYGAPTVALFKVDAHGAYATVYNLSFNEGESFNQLTSARGQFYGSATIGGVVSPTYSGGYGTLFKFIPGQSIDVLRQFNPTSTTVDAGFPTGPLLLASDGNLYWTSLGGGSSKSGDGTVFKLDSKDRFSIVHSFIGTDGQGPLGGLVQGRNGVLYGTTNAGGKTNQGAVFGMTAAGKVTVLHSFGDPSVPHDGQTPVAGLVFGRDGNLYGTTSAGGSAGQGTVFRMTTEGKETILHSFSTTPEDGMNPSGVLTLGMDGNLYGSTPWGGANASGTIFKVVIDSPPTLTVSLTSSVKSITAGNNIVYSIGCTNHGEVAAYDVQLSVTLPAHTTLVSQGSIGSGWNQVGNQLSYDLV